MTYRIIVDIVDGEYKTLEAPKKTDKPVFVLKELTTSIAWSLRKYYQKLYKNEDMGDSFISFMESLMESVENANGTFFPPVVLEGIFYFYVGKLELANKEFFRT